MFELNCAPVSAPSPSNNFFRSCGTRAQSSASSVRIFVTNTGGCGGFFRSCRFCGTTGYGNGGIPSDDDTCAGGGFGRSNGGGSGGFGAATATPATTPTQPITRMLMPASCTISPRSSPPNQPHFPAAPPPQGVRQIVKISLYSPAAARRQSACDKGFVQNAAGITAARRLKRRRPTGFFPGHPR